MILNKEITTENIENFIGMEANIKVLGNSYLGDEGFITEKITYRNVQILDFDKSAIKVKFKTNSGKILFLNPISISLNYK